MCLFSITLHDKIVKFFLSLTPLEVAKSEYLHLFINGDMRSASALSNRTIRPADSFASLNSLYFGSQTDSTSIFSTDHFDLDGTIHQLLSSLRVTSPSAPHRKNSEHIHYLKASLAQTTHQCDQIIQHFRDRINEATRVVSDLQKNADKIDAMRDAVVVATKGKLVSRNIFPTKRHRDRDSEDSQTTIVSVDDIAGPSIDTRDSDYAAGHTSTSTQTTLIDRFFAHRPISSPVPTWLDRFIPSPDPTTTYKSHPLREVEWEFSELQKRDSALSSSKSKIALTFKQLAKKKRKLEEKIYNLQLEAGMGKTSLSSTSRVKAWLKRMVVPVHSPRKLEIVFDIDEKNCVVGREVKCLQMPSTSCGDAIDASIDNALKTSQVVLEAVKRDLQTINGSLIAVKFYSRFYC